MTAIPSRAITVSTSPARSSGLRSREEVPISAWPDRAALIPAPEPPPATVMVTLGLACMKALASSSARGWTEVEPTTLREPLRPPAVPAPVAMIEAAAASTAMIAIDAILFIFHTTSFNHPRLK